MELTLEVLKKYLQKHSIDCARHKRLLDYYRGQHDICKKTVSDIRKPCNRLVTNFAGYIADNYTAYMVGNPVNYSGQDDLSGLNDIMAYNDADDTDTQIARDINIFGKAFELLWMDADSVIRFKAISPLDMFVIRDDTLEDNIAYGVRIYRVAKMDISDTVETFVEVYSPVDVATYKTDNTFSYLELVNSQPHYFKDVPVVEYNDNSSFEGVISLIDAYEKLSSAEVDDYQAFVDAIMLLKGVTADDDTAFSLMDKRIMCLPEDGNAAYLTKQVNTQQIAEIKAELVQQIHKISNCPDFSSDAFATSSGIAMQYKLLGFTNVAKNKIRHMTLGIRRRLELIGNILAMTSNGIDFYDIQIVFNPALPVDLDGIVAEVNNLRGLVSNKTLISQLPFVVDVDAEIKQVADETAAANPFSLDAETGV